MAVLVGYMMDQADKAHLREEDWHRTIFVDSKRVGTVECGISDDRMQELVQSGRDCASEYFKWFESTPRA